MTQVGMELISNTNTAHIRSNTPRILQESSQQAAYLLTLPEPAIALESRTAGPGLIPNIVHRSDSA